MSDKDYSLLRPFDLEAAKRGESICYKTDAAAKYIAGPNRLDTVVVQWNDDQFHMTHKNNLRMAPLCWVRVSSDDPTLKPVYKGDVLYYSERGAWRKFEVQGCNQFGKDAPVFLENVPNEHGVGVGIAPEKLTWTPPKVKREGWGVVRIGKVSETREEAESILKQHGARDVLADVFDGELRVVRIEWEDPAGLEGGAQ